VRGEVTEKKRRREVRAWATYIQAEVVQVIFPTVQLTIVLVKFSDMVGQIQLSRRVQADMMSEKRMHETRGRSMENTAVKSAWSSPQFLKSRTGSKLNDISLTF